MKKVNLKKYDQILFCGIGGSSVPGEIVKALNLKKPVLIARENLPGSVNSKTLVFVVSYSGNTKETINLYKRAKKLRARTIIITSGGKLGNASEEKILVPKGMMPRNAYVEMLSPILNLLGIKSINLRKFAGKIKKETAKKIARNIRGKLPVIYVSSEDLKIISDKWVDNLNEDSKILAHGGYFPEISHNEIEARLGKEIKVVLLFDKKTKLIKRSEKFLNPVEVKLKGRSILEKIIYGIYLGDLVSYYLSLLLKIDYKKTERIDSLKR